MCGIKTIADHQGRWRVHSWDYILWRLESANERKLPCSQHKPNTEPEPLLCTIWDLGGSGCGECSQEEKAEASPSHWEVLLSPICSTISSPLEACGTVAPGREPHLQVNGRGTQLQLRGGEPLLQGHRRSDISRHMGRVIILITLVPTVVLCPWLGPYDYTCVYESALWVLCSKQRQRPPAGLNFSLEWYQ